MNYIVVYKKEGKLSTIFFKYRDESNIGFNEDTFIRNEDEVIRVMYTYFHPDDNAMVIRETFLDLDCLRENLDDIILKMLNYL